MKESRLKAIDFFCGAGGMTYGISQADIRVLAGIDIDPDCKETYQLNNLDSVFIERDIFEFSEEELSEITGIKRDDDSLLFIGCSPCQYWTRINTSKEKSAKSKDLLREFQRFVSWFKPGYIIIENVPGLLNTKNEKTLDNFLAFLKHEKYAYDHGLINANHYGVPQNRKRYLLISTRLSDNIRIPKGRSDKSLILRNYLGYGKGFPVVEAGHKDKTYFMHTVAALSEKNKLRIEKTPKDGGTRLSWKDDPELQIDAYRDKDHIFKDVYGRMFWDKPAPTITTRFNSLSNGRFGHPYENRAISLREGATLQTFPKTYIFRGTSEVSIARQIGNAVPPEMAKRIVQNIKEDWRNAILSN
ncbi:MAG: DNA cytosine methyltransferase [Thermotogota bacterium]|nr:DNA cytosine methyltransferase [Thermotogota bacterium]